MEEGTEPMVSVAIRDVAIGRKGDRLGLGVRMDMDPVHLRLSPKLSEQGVVYGPAVSPVATLKKVAGLRWLL